MNFEILTLFPEYVDGILSESIIGRARRAGLINITCHNIRDYAIDEKGYIDKKPYGATTGMLIEPQPVYDCFEAAAKKYKEKPFCIYMSPQGRVLDQGLAKELKEKENLVFICGHYEGIDERVLNEIVDMELSIGDYVLTGGELPACIAVDCISRMVDGVLASEESFSDESHYNGLLEYPQYTQPPVFHGKAVPELLRSGNTAVINKWRMERSLDNTLKKRPDMLKNASLSRDALDYLENKAKGEQ